MNAKLETLPGLREIERFSGAVDLPPAKIEPDPVHRFVPGAYVREVTLSENCLFIGHQHRHEHLNVILCGKGMLCINGGDPVLIVGPVSFACPPGTRKALFVFEEMIWQTVHATETRDLAALESELLVKSTAFDAFNADVRRIKEEFHACLLARQ